MKYELNKLYNMDCMEAMKDIPDKYAGNLVRAADYVRSMPQICRQVVTDWEGSDKWFIYVGAIPPEWISWEEGAIADEPR